MRYFAEEIWTGLKTGAEKLEALLLQESWSKTELTSNPYRVQWLLTKLKELRVQAQTLDKNSAFRPTISQVGSVVHVQVIISTVIMARIVQVLGKFYVVLFTRPRQ